MPMNDPTNYWASSPLPHPVAFPQWRYHPIKEPVQVRSEEEANALGEGWSPTYIHKAYPKMKFKLKVNPKEGEPHYETVIVESPEAEQKLEGGWADTLPAAPHAGQLPAEEPTASPRRR